MKELKFKKCMVCGTIVEVLEGNGNLICCGKTMTDLIPNSVDASFEKHVPTYEVEGNNIRAKVNHVMESDHYIEWIIVQITLWKVTITSNGLLFKQKNKFIK